MTMSTNPDGSTKFLIVQLTDFNGFARYRFCVHEDQAHQKPGFAAREKRSSPGRRWPIATAWRSLPTANCPRQQPGEHMLYSYSLPDLKCVGAAELGGMGAAGLHDPRRKTAYVANAVTNDVSAVGHQVNERSRAHPGRIRAKRIRLGCSRNKIALSGGKLLF